MRIIWIIIIFLLISTRPLLAQEIVPGKTKTSSIGYQSQNLFYLFLIKDYLSILRLAGDKTSTAEEKELIQFLLQLFVSSETQKILSPNKFNLDDPSLLRLQAIALGSRKFEESLALSRMLPDGGEARYREGMSFLSLRKLEDADKAMKQVQADNSLYPYARIALAQKEVMKQNLDGAENYVRELIANPLLSKSNLSERARLLLGQILFEKGRYSDALQEFVNISPNTPLYEDAVLGQAWCYVKLGDYVKAVPLFERVKKDILNQIGREAFIAIGHCRIKSGDLVQAKKYFQGLLTISASREKQLSRLIEDKTLRKKYMAMLEGYAEPMTEEEQYYLSYLSNDSTIKALLSEIRYINIIKAGFLKTERELANDETYLDNIGIGLNELVSRMDGEVSRFKEILRKTDIPIDPGSARSRQAGSEVAGSTSTDFYASNMYGAWGYAVDREISNETKYVAKVILQEFMRDNQSRCFDDPIVCHIASFVIHNKANFDQSQIRRIVTLLDSMVGDLKRVKAGEKIYFEELISGMRNLTDNKINTVNKALGAFKKVKAALDINLKETEKALENAYNILDMHIMQSAVNTRYELGDFKDRVATGINSIEKTEN